ncbi:MAG: glutamine--fructose-6-phosphate aminotransferase [Chlamydiae bacterium RIFCSPHIGHO2_12_FULL_44_59]|nr:MAG: glutamine--fructose-6-phosphate aminotransferase [Chlamydiae bacterium RIFCSPHIGHO2_01_FULL_44_39]OGN59846.1 MAG: glutamine--fructose-6-phosphate aminotransferase [Chlamydiae bacterium RIFCSPHIGHO2_12_FULL_44_59]OGN66053.1 MAG: glutamine--fructose-6-phosphate aminotransferase [Chlamydiae bacterium RIFCSPLOWO2_01_FULL_44_52]OGN68589.1 MAG: glutamine--fructose-6-phosphate aminotransferase [Chlamydiae bacterium RIFCSPLOWO2_02_FULL_45_22]OGN69701.1 MAG: glutamine--fructose-6-phosphate amino
MCGIFGYIGEDDALNTCILGLEQLEYRGYDSTGIAGIFDGNLQICKETGKLANLKQRLTFKTLQIAIGHTRWATHGKVTTANAHPHNDSQRTIALVHNGIIENWEELRDQLKKEGFVFVTETDTEVITQLVSKNYKGSLVDAVQTALPFLKGQFAIALIHKDHPDQIVASARNCPLSIGFNDTQTESIISSDLHAFLGKPLNVIFLRDDEVAKVERGKVSVFDKNLARIAKKLDKLDRDFKSPSKEGYEHFMLKEIYEQPTTIQKAYFGRVNDGCVLFEDLVLDLSATKNVWFIGCGTSAHAAAIGGNFFEEIAEIPAQVEIASEARYRMIPPGTLVVAMSQSGETADVLSAVREIKAKGHKILGICNVKNSTLTREVDACIFLNAGPEISVCSTKAFTSQITVLYLLALHLAKKGDFDALQLIPQHIQQVLENALWIEEKAKHYSRYQNFFFMGRRYMYPTCLEAALKLKEISYVNAVGYLGGEIKHGPIALIDENCPVLAFLANSQTESKMMGNLQEVKARGAPILAFAPKHLSSISTIADDVIWLPDTIDPLSPFASTVAGQLFAYFMAKTRKCDIDQPRNLAKSVTVE